MTLTCTLLIQMSSSATSSQKDSWKINQEAISFSLLFSNASVLVVGILFILQAIFIEATKDYSHLVLEMVNSRDSVFSDMTLGTIQIPSIFPRSSSKDEKGQIKKSPRKKKKKKAVKKKI